MSLSRLRADLAWKLKMQPAQVPLNFTHGQKWVSLRELCGYDEQSVAGTGAVEAIRLIDRLLVDSSNPEISPGKAKLLTISDRDRLLAAIYMHNYGSTIQSTLMCERCDALFDLDFSLEELTRHLQSKMSKSEVKRGPEGDFKLSASRRFRLPTGEDEYAVLGMPLEEAEKELLKRCVLEGDPQKDAKQLQKAMKKLAPVLDLDIKASCPYCSHRQTVHFDIQNCLLTAIRQEQKQLVLEVHRLATAYAWSLKEILGLPRRLRRAYVALVESEFGSNQRIRP